MMRVAKKYWDTAFSGLENRMDEIEKIPPSSKLLEKFLESAGMESGRILDLGCGFGRNAVYLAEKGFDVVGTDVSANAISICKQRFQIHGFSGVFKTGTFNKIQFNDDYFDAVICIAAFDHITFPDAQKALMQIRRVVKPSGCVLMTFDPENTDQDRKHEAKLLKDGTMKFVKGDQKGMLFRPYTDQEIRALIGEGNIRHFHTAEHGSRIIFCS